MPLRTRAVGRLFVSAQIVLLGALVLLPGARHWVDPPAVVTVLTQRPWLAWASSQLLPSVSGQC